MYSVPPARAWWPAVGAPLERGVRRHCAGAALEICRSSVALIPRGLLGMPAVEAFAVAAHVPLSRGARCRMEILISSGRSLDTDGVQLGQLQQLKFCRCVAASTAMKIVPGNQGVGEVLNLVQSYRSVEPRLKD